MTGLTAGIPEISLIPQNPSSDKWVNYKIAIPKPSGAFSFANRDIPASVIAGIDMEDYKIFSDYNGFWGGPGFGCFCADSCFAR